MDTTSISDEEIFCILQHVQDMLHNALRRYPWRLVDIVDASLRVTRKAAGELTLEIDVSVSGNRPLVPSYDEVLAKLIDDVRRYFEAIVSEGVCKASN
ncbi:MAG: hypothetical protein LRS47_01720 [Desulfurococcales archaeon]|nr:hypothetical protein [Desulfurococcales archaeon]